MDRAAARTGRHRLPAIYVGIDGGAEGRDGQPRQHIGQRARRSSGAFGIGSRPTSGQLAAAVSRHGIDRYAATADLQPASRRVLMAPRSFIERPRALARAIARHGGTVSGATRLRVRLCVQRIAATIAGDARSTPMAARVLRSRANPARTFHAFAERFRARRLRRASALSLLRPRRGDADRDGWRAGRGVEVRPSTRRPCSRAATSRRSAAAHWFAAARAPG